MATRNYEGQKFELDEANITFDLLSVEEPLQININNKPFTMTMRTPGNDDRLVRGLLYSEGVLKDLNYMPEILLNKESENTIVTVANLSVPEARLGDGYKNSRSLLSVSSCGICGRTELGDQSFERKINEDQKLDFYVLQETFHIMNSLQHSFRQSGGTHAAAAFTIHGELLSLMEDIGRHNAVDKVIGELILSEKICQASCLTVSGRVSYEIVIKCFSAGIPFLAAVSAPSSLAVDYAKELGITLFAFCRDNRATCYSNPQRVNIKKQLFKAS